MWGGLFHSTGLLKPGQGKGLIQGPLSPARQKPSLTVTGFPAAPRASPTCVRACVGMCVWVNQWALPLPLSYKGLADVHTGFSCPSSLGGREGGRAHPILQMVRLRLS